MRRLTRFPAVRNFELRDWNRIEMRIRPAITGREPASPPRTRATHARRYSPKVWAMSSGATAMAAASAVDSVSSSTAETCGSSVVATVSPIGAAGRRARGHDLDDRLHVELGRRAHGCHPAQEQDGDPVCDLAG